MIFEELRIRDVVVRPAHILAPMETLQQIHTAWSSLVKHCQLFVAFGGLPVKNAPTPTRAPASSDSTASRRVLPKASGRCPNEGFN